MEQAYPLDSYPHVSYPSKYTALLRNGAFALGVTGLLLLGMTQLIATDYRAPPDDPVPRIAPIHMPDMKPTVRREEPVPKPQELPPPLQPTTVERTVEPGDVSVLINPPVISGEKHGPALVSSDPLPIYKPAPRYPRRALAKGIQGYVVVEFTITKNGSVRDPSVVGGYDSHGVPTDVFDGAALSAVARFKYRPPLADGEPVEQSGVRNRITFRLAE